MHDSPTLSDMEEIEARITAAMAESALLAGLEVTEAIRIVAGNRAILRGTLNGRAVVLRLFLAKPQIAESEGAEMTRLWAYMHDGCARVAEPIAVLPAHGLIVMAALEGPTLMQALRACENRTEQALLLPPAAEWLRRYTKPTEERVPANPARWLDRAREAAATQPFPRLRELEAVILTHMARLTKEIDGRQWRTAICHGDYHVANLIVTEAGPPPVLTGIDLGGSARLPVYKDIARFLTHMARRGPRPSGRRAFGVDLAGVQAFTESYALDPEERRLCLPFFLCFEALIRVENPSLSDGRISRAEAMAQGLIAGLEGLD